MLFQIDLFNLELAKMLNVQVHLYLPVFLLNIIVIILSLIYAGYFAMDGRLGHPCNYGLYK